MHAASPGIHAIGRGLADAQDLDPKHVIKQVDRLLSNRGIVIWAWFAQWVTFVVADRKELLVAFDWTEFDEDGQATIALYAVTSHGRATPLVWKTIDKSKLKERRGEYELEVVSRLHEILPADVDVTVIADRGFGDQKLFAWLDTIGWVHHSLSPEHHRGVRRREQARKRVGSAERPREDAARCSHHTWEAPSRGGGPEASERHEGGGASRRTVPSWRRRR
ncbi:MAG: hypothetical protein NVSMB68_14840 [Thermoanaerobaculia bacterium]